jgi:predicted Zn-dependent peptidase
METDVLPAGTTVAEHAVAHNKMDRVTQGRVVAWHGAFNLPPIYQDDLNGLPVFWASVPGPARAALVFRTGRVDEPLVRGGVSHLVEHLALTALGSVPYSRNGHVEPLRTVFYAHGTQQEVADFLSGVTAALQSLPWHRLFLERQVLRTEAASRSTTVFESLLATRFGARSHGALAYEELGLRGLGSDYIGDWAAQHFCKENAAVWMTVPPPEGLHVSLPSGTRWPYPEARELTFQKPAAVFQQQPRGVAFSATVHRSVAASSLGRILQRRLQDTLRNELGLTYAVNAAYYVVDAERALIYVAADCLPAEAPGLAIRMRELLEGVANSGTTPTEIAQDADALRRATADPMSMLALLDRFATASLTDDEPAPPDVLLRKLEAVEPASHAKLMSGALANAIWALPAGTGAGLPACPEWSAQRLTGKDFVPRSKGRKGNSPTKLTVGSDGVTCWQDEARVVTVLYDDCAALLRWQDGQRVILGNDGFRIPIVPSRWKKGEQAVEAVDSHIERALWVGMGQGEPPQTRRRRKRYIYKYSRSRFLLSLVAGLAAFALYYTGVTSTQSTDAVSSLAQLSFSNALLFAAGVVGLCTATVQALCLTWARLRAKKNRNI